MKKKSSSKDFSKRRAERAMVERRLKGVFLKVPELSAKDLRVLNISELGMGVEPPRGSASVPPSATHEFEGKILVGTTVAPVRLKLIHRRPEMMGLEFVEPSELLRSAIRAYFEPELVGAAMRRVDSGVHTNLTTPIERYQDAAGNRVDLELHEGGVKSLTMTILGSRLQWSVGGALQLEQNGLVKPVSEGFRKQLIELVRNIDAMNDAVREFLVGVLSGLPPR